MFINFTLLNEKFQKTQSIFHTPQSKKAYFLADKGLPTPPPHHSAKNLSLFGSLAENPEFAGMLRYFT